MGKIVLSCYKHDDKSALKYSSLSPCCSWFNCLCDWTLNCVWENLSWWHSFTFYRTGRDDWLVVGTIHQLDLLVMEWYYGTTVWWVSKGQTWQLIDNCKMSFYTLLTVCPCPGGKIITSTPVSLLLTGPSGVYSLSSPVLCEIPGSILLCLQGSTFFTNRGSSEAPGSSASMRLSFWGWQQQANTVTHIWSTPALCRDGLNQSSEMKWVTSCLAGAQKQNCAHYSCWA